MLIVMYNINVLIRETGKGWDFSLFTREKGHIIWHSWIQMRHHPILFLATT